MTVTVAMPYYGVPEYVEQAVRSVLAQTHRDLRLVVVGDGQDPPLHGIRDPRLVVYRLPENRGTYFALQLVLTASSEAWHAPHAADDWSDPTHLESLLALSHPAVAMGACWVHEGDAATVTSIGKEGWHVGLFASERLKAIGGYDPSARLSQDTHVLKLLDMTGGYLRHRSADPTYHIRRRPGSLTMAPATGMTSKVRRIARSRDRVIRDRCRRKSEREIRAYRESLVPHAVMAELQDHASSLRAML